MGLSWFIEDTPRLLALMGTTGDIYDKPKVWIVAIFYIYSTLW